MTIQSECTGCGALLSVADEHAGNTAQCPQCEQTYQVPEVTRGESDSADATGDQAAEDWFLRTPEGKTYGPVKREVLDQWLSEGRVAADCQVRRMETDWQNAGAIYPQLAVTAAPVGNPFAANQKLHSSTSTSQFIEPHRGGLILGLGVAGFLVPCPVLSMMAWAMGNGDLRRMQAGRMDPNGYQVTQAGRIFGMIFSILWLLLFGVMALVILLALAAS